MSWLGRLVRLDYTVFEELRSNSSATPTAILIVLATGVIAGFGTWLWALQHDNFTGVDVMEVLLKAVVIGSVVQLAVWFAWVYITYMLAARVFGSVVRFGELTRGLGFAFAPVAVAVLVASRRAVGGWPPPRALRGCCGGSRRWQCRSAWWRSE